jgi:UDP-glucuronate 4-epimerase
MAPNEAPKSYLVTGCAGFIANRVAHLLLDQGHHVVGLDNMNDYYDVSLKEHRLQKLKHLDRFKFYQMDLEDRGALKNIFEQYSRRKGWREV